MRCRREILRLYAVTDRAWTGKQSLAEQVEAAIRGGVSCVQLREKQLAEEDFLAEALVLQALCRKYQVPFIVNDNVQVAIRCGADGVHVGQEDMEAGNVRKRIGEDMLLGVSVQTVEQALAAERAGADYLGAGAVFSTATKKDACAVSYDVLKEICAAVELPVVAIGGINRDNMKDLRGSGIDGVAMVSAIFGAENIEEECRSLEGLSRSLFQKTKSVL